MATWLVGLLCFIGGALLGFFFFVLCISQSYEGSIRVHVIGDKIERMQIIFMDHAAKDRVAKGKYKTALFKIDRVLYRDEEEPQLPQSL